MSWFQLDPESVLQRARASGSVVEIPFLSTSVWRGIVGFTLLSVAGFAPWAFFGRWFYRQIGEGGLYAVCALVFIGLSGPLLHRLVIGPGSLPRFYKLFCIAFSPYSVLWICGWMFLRGHLGSAVGLLAGTTAMGLILALAFDAKGFPFKVITALFLLNSIGYFVGGWIEGSVMAMKSIPMTAVVLARPTQSLIAKLLWGVCYGAGFGAGLALAFHLCQRRTRAMLASLGMGLVPASEQHPLR